MVTIIFESHGTTYDNEAHIASGHSDVALSALGEQQAKELGERYLQKNIDAIFCSDLQRSYRTAEIAFASRNVPIFRDARLRECDYGKFTGHPSQEIEEARPQHIASSFPGGENYEQAAQRMKSFLEELKKNYDDKTVLVIGHRATQYGLEHLASRKTLAEIIAAPWKWQPGWHYQY